MKKNKIKVVGNYGNGHHAKNIYDADGLAPAITTGNHGLGTMVAIYGKRKSKK